MDQTVPDNGVLPVYDQVSARGKHVRHWETRVFGGPRLQTLARNGTTQVTMRFRNRVSCSQVCHISGNLHQKTSNHWKTMLLTPSCLFSVMETYLKRDEEGISADLRTITPVHHRKAVFSRTGEKKALGIIALTQLKIWYVCSMCSHNKCLESEKLLLSVQNLFAYLW